MPPLLFLSHAGVDTDAAAKLKRRIEDALEARKANLKVWFDKDELQPGPRPWVQQIEEALKNSSAFAVYVGSSGVINWVQAEVNVALDRAVKEASYAFFPLLADSLKPEQLPGFMRQYQAVRLEIDEEFQRFIKAALGNERIGEIRLEEEPFPGLQAMSENHSHLFFGREDETEKLLALVDTCPLVLVSGDSGSGKSSLVRAGLVPRFRGGALGALHDPPAPRETIWQVVITRPRDDPWRFLGEAVEEVAQQMGKSLDDQATLARSATNEHDFNEVRRGIRCGLAPTQVRVLLVVDQFEELLTVTPEARRESFIRLLLDMSRSDDPAFRVVLTMRQDYVNLLSAHKEMAERLDADDRRARFNLGRMSDEGLKHIVCKPLRLAGVSEDEGKALARAVLRDVSQRPGDLALVQMALRETWNARSSYDGNLLRAYSEVGRVEGALAKAADYVLARLKVEEKPLLDDILVRLVRLGDTGGATRRMATRDEFSENEWKLVQELASEDGKRLVLLVDGQDKVIAEIAHEALVTGWPHFQTFLHGAADDKRALDALIPRVKSWVENDKDPERLATGADRVRFAALAKSRSGWLSLDEGEFVADSQEAADRRARLERLNKWTLRSIAVVSFVAFLGAAYLGWQAQQQRNMAISRELGVRASAQEDKELGLLLAEQAVLKKSTAEAEDTLRELLVESKVLAQMPHDAAVRTAAFSFDDSLVVTASGEVAQVWDAKSGEPFAADPMIHPDQVEGAVFADKNDTVVTAGRDGIARVWKKMEVTAVGAEGGKRWTWKEAGVQFDHGSRLTSVAVSPDARFLATGGADGYARIWDLGTKEKVREFDHSYGVKINDQLEERRREINSMAFDPDGNRLYTASATNVWTWNYKGEPSGRWARVLLQLNEDLTSGEPGGILIKGTSPDPVQTVSFSKADTRTYGMSAGPMKVLVWEPDPELFDRSSLRLPNTLTLRDSDSTGMAAFASRTDLLVVAEDDRTMQVWKILSDGEAIRLTKLACHGDKINSISFSGDGRSVVTASDDMTARVWATSAKRLTPFKTEVRFKTEVQSFSPEGERLLIAGGWVAEVWDVIGGHLQYGPASDPAAVRDIKKPIRLPHEDPVSAALFSPDGELVATASGRAVQLWNARTAGELGPPMLHDAPVSKVQFSRNGELLLTLEGEENEERTVRTWDAKTREPARSMEHSNPVVAAAFTEEADAIITASGKQVFQWDAKAGTQIGEPLARAAPISAATFDCQARFLAIVQGDTAELWETKKLGPDDGPLIQEPARLVALSCDGSRLATLTSDTARVWDTQKNTRIGKEIRVGKEVRYKPVVAATFSSDGKLLVTGSERGRVRVWDAASGRLITSFKDGNLAVTRLSFSPDGKVLVTADAEALRIYREERFAPVGTLLGWARERVSRELTKAEREEYLH